MQYRSECDEIVEERLVDIADKWSRDRGKGDKRKLVVEQSRFSRDRS